MRSASTRI